MASLTEEQFAAKLAEVQGPLDHLERLICHQSGDLVENFEDLLRAKKVQLSKKETKARNASEVYCAWCAKDVCLELLRICFESIYETACDREWWDKTSGLKGDAKLHLRVRAFRDCMCVKTNPRSFHVS